MNKNPNFEKSINRDLRLSIQSIVCGLTGEMRDNPPDIIDGLNAHRLMRMGVSKTRFHHNIDWMMEIAKR